MAVALYPDNDWTHSIKLYDVAAGAVRRSPLTTGTVMGFFSTSALSTGTVTGGLVITCVHVANGVWRVSCDASLLTASALATAFASATPYAHIVQANGIHTIVECVYTPSRYATVEA